MSVILWTIVGFLSGSLMFSLWLGKLALHKDVRDFGDGNPGAFNVIVTGGWKWGALALLLDTVKGAIPVWLAKNAAGLTGWQLAIAALAPILGHAFSPFLGFRGGKAVAVTFGVWMGLTVWEAPTIMGILLGIWFALIEVSGWAVMAMMTCLLAYYLLVNRDPVYLTVWTVNAALLAHKYRADLRRFPQPRVWLKAKLGWR